MNEPDVSDLMTVRQAIALLDAVPVVTRTQKSPLRQALGLYLAQEIVADRDYPPFDKSLMDGFAIRGSESAQFRIAGEIRAGEMREQSLAPGEAVSIMTGAPLPPGADGVVPIEFTQRIADAMRITRSADFTRFVARRGSDCPGGAVVLTRGVKLEASQMAAAATVGAHEVEVYTPPRVAILATGDELVPIDAQPQPQQIRNSNSPMLQALLARFGCVVTDLGVVKDDMPSLRAALEKGLAFDALFITGGMSVGAYDLPPKALRELGATLQITRLKIKPGKPFIYARHRGCHIFGLPGNPLAGFVCTVRLASRVLRRMMGGDPSADEIQSTLGSALAANGPREFYQPAIVQGVVVHPLDWRSSADVFTLAGANALLIRAESEPAQSVGAACKILCIGS
jgi:molybdopterin molybdotransferase